MSTIAQHVREQLRAIMEEQGVTQHELARRMGIPHPNVWRLLKGPHVPTLDMLEKMAAALGCSLGVVVEPAEKISA